MQSNVRNITATLNLNQKSSQSYGWIKTDSIYDTCNDKKILSTKWQYQFPKVHKDNIKISKAII